MSIDEPPEGPFDGAPGGHGDDPFAGLTLDEAWIAGAGVHEPTARRRVAEASWDQAAREAEEIEARHWRARRRRRRRNRAYVLVGILLFAAAIAIADRRPTESSTWQTTSGDAPDLVLGGRPTPTAAASSTPLGTPEDPDAAGGTYGFLATQRDGTTPVAYDPCRPIEIALNDLEAPPGGRAIVDRAVARVTEVTGLDIRITRSTNEIPSLERAAYQPDRYGDRWAPVLFAWTDPGEVPGLGGDVAGLAGSVPVETDDVTGDRTYVSGLVLIDGPGAEQILQRDGGAQVVEDIVLHELGHLVGLAHVADTSELMYEQGQEGVHGYQQGDRTGLTQLGQGPCIPQL